MGTEAKNRICGFDALRGLMILCVVAIHAAMTYMAYVPAWWYVKDTNDSVLLAMVVIVLDTFPMTVLFFLSGYFAPGSLAKRGQARFISEKLIRIGAAWIAGVALFGPLFGWWTYEALRPSLKLPQVTYGDFIAKFFFGPFYQQGQYWFLGVLLVLFIAFSFCHVGKWERSVGKRPSVAMIVGLWALGTAAYDISSAFVMPADDWIKIAYTLYLQPARIVHYIAFFALGVVGWRRRWFTPDGWKPDLRVWGAAAFASVVVLLMWQFHWTMGMGETANRAMHAATFNLMAVTVPFFLVGLFVNLAYSKVWIDIGTASYGVYWLHMPLLMVMQQFMIPLGWPIAAKFLFSVAANYALCQLITVYVLLKTPVLKKIFLG